MCRENSVYSCSVRCRRRPRAATPEERDHKYRGDSEGSHSGFALWIDERCVMTVIILLFFGV